MPFFKKNPEPIIQPTNNTIREDKDLRIQNICEQKHEEIPRLISFTYEIKSHPEAGYFFDNNNSSCNNLFTHNTNKAGFSTVIVMSRLNFDVLFKFGSTNTPEITKTTEKKIQYISCGFGTPRTHDYKEAYRFKREILRIEYTMAGLSLADYLKLQTHLPTVVDFLKLYEATPNMAHRDIELSKNTLYVRHGDNDPRLTEDGAILAVLPLSS